MKRETTRQLADRYADALLETIKQVRTTQREAIARAAGRCFDAIRGGGTIHTFGSGHSAYVAADVACRAGGLVPVDCIFEPSLVDPAHGKRTEILERVDGIGEALFAGWNPMPSDCLIVVSQSGRNSAVVGFARAARAAGVPVIAVTSVSHSKRHGPANSSGLCLWECSDEVIDTCVPPGDALLEDVIDGWSAGPASTAVSSFITQSLVLDVVDRYLEIGERPPVLMSANVPEGDAWNAEAIRAWKGRVGAASATSVPSNP